MKSRKERRLARLLGGGSEGVDVIEGASKDRREVMAAATPVNHD